MVLFLCRIKQSQLRNLSNQFKRCYFQIHGSSSLMHETRIGVRNTPSFAFQRTGSEIGNHVRFFAAPVQAKPKYEDKDKGRPRMNEQISAQYVRLVTDEGHSVVSRHEALERARRLNVDLVEVQPDGKPPVCKLMDYNKEMYVKQVKEKELTKKKSDSVLRKGGLKEVRITPKIDKNDLQTKADTVKRLAERGYRIKCMAVGTADQDLGGLLSRLSNLIDEFSLVESGPRVEAKQAYIVVRHIKYGPLKKGPSKKKLLETSTTNASTENPEEAEDESEPEIEEETYSEEPMEADYTADSNYTTKFAPEASIGNSSSPRIENRYATRPTNVSDPGVRRRFDSESQNQGNNRQFDLNRRDPNGPGSSSSYGMFGAPKPNKDNSRESGPVEVNRYKKGPTSQPPPPSDYNRGPRGGDFNSNMNPIRERQAGFRR